MQLAKLGIDNADDEHYIESLLITKKIAATKAGCAKRELRY